MSHKKVRLYIENIARSLGDNVQFTYARASDFNVMRDKKYPFVVLDPLTSTPEYSDTGILFINWNVQLAFYEIDDASSDQDQYSSILDDMHELVMQFMARLNLSENEASYTSSGFGIGDSAYPSGITMQPFIKVGADILTGWILGFSLNVYTHNCIDNDC